MPRFREVHVKPLQINGLTRSMRKPWGRVPALESRLLHGAVSTPRTSMLSKSAIQFLSDTSAQDLTTYLIHDVCLVSQGHEAMCWLLRNRANVANEVLCNLYGLTCLRVGDSCRKNSEPAHNHDQWFVTSPTGAAAAVRHILADSEDLARSLTVSCMGLRHRFFSTVEIFEQEEAFE